MEKLLAKALRLVDEAEIYFLESSSLAVGFSAGALKSMNRSQNAGVGLRVIKSGRLGFATSSNLDALDLLLEKATALAEKGHQVPFHFAGPAALPALDLYDPAVEQVEVNDLVRQGESMVARLREYDSGLQIFAGLGAGSLTVRVLTSHGLDASYRRTSFTMGAGAQLIQPENILTVYDTYEGLGPWTEARLRAIGDRCIEDLSIGRRNVPIAGGPKKVIFTPSAMADIFLAFEEGIDGSAVAKGTSPLIGKLGRRILSPRVNILDDGLRADGPGSCPFDDEGVPSRCTPIIRNGELASYITDLKSAAQTGQPATGNGLRHTSLIRAKDFGVGPGPDGRNYVLQPGEPSLAEVMAGIDEGLIVDSVTGILLGNLINGDFSGNIELGFKIDHGQKIGRVKNVMIAGNFYDLFGDRLAAICNDPVWTGNFGGEAGSYSLPHTFFEGVSVSA